RGGNAPAGRVRGARAGRRCPLGARPGARALGQPRDGRQGLPEAVGLGGLRRAEGRRNFRRRLAPLDEEGGAPARPRRRSGALGEPGGDARRNAAGVRRGAFFRLEGVGRKKRRKSVSSIENLAAVSVEGLTVRYGGIAACSDVTFSVARGSV